MKLSIIIPCFNAESTLAEQLEALANQEWSEPWEVILADNGSTDNSLKIAQQFRERLSNLQIVDASERPGASYARNVGASAAAGTLLAFCDADDEVAPGWIAAMGHALSCHDFVAGRVDLQKLNRPEVLDPTWDNTDGLAMTYPPFLPIAGSGNFGIKRAIHQAVCGFDESIPCFEDVDYSWRVQLAGTELHYIPNALVHVRLRNSLWNLFKRACDYGDAEVFIYQRYRPLGMPKRKWTVSIRDWWGLLKRFSQVKTVQDRATFISRCGRYTGRIRGSFKYKILY